MAGHMPHGAAGAAAGAAGAKLGGDLRAMALAHREGDPRAAMSRAAVRTRAVLLILVNLGLATLLVAASTAGGSVPTYGRVIMVSIGAFWALTALLLVPGWSLRPSRRRLVSTTTVNGQPATVIRMSRHRMLETLWFSGGTVALCVMGSVMAIASDGAGLLLFTGALIVILLPVAIDMLLALLRPVGITLTREGIEVRSWYSRGALPWNELSSVRLMTYTHGTRLIVDGGRIPARQPQQLFAIWPTHERHEPDELNIDVDAIEPHGRPLEALLTEIVETRSPFRRSKPDDITSKMGTPWAEQALQPGQPEQRGPDDPPPGITFH